MPSEIQHSACTGVDGPSFQESDFPDSSCGVLQQHDIIGARPPFPQMYGALPPPTAPGRTPKLRQKRVRFSELCRGTTAAESARLSTGVTSSVRRASLGEPSPACRREVPAVMRRISNGSTSSSSPEASDASFIPLRQVLDGRVKRRHRRDAAGEELRRTSSEKLSQSMALEEELKKLREQLRQRDQEIERLRQESATSSSEPLPDDSLHIAKLGEMQCENDENQCPESLSVPSEPSVNDATFYDGFYYEKYDKLHQREENQSPETLSVSNMENAVPVGKILRQDDEVAQQNPENCQVRQESISTASDPSTQDPLRIENPDKQILRPNRLTQDTQDMDMELPPTQLQGSNCAGELDMEHSKQWALLSKPGENESGTGTTHDEEQHAEAGDGWTVLAKDPFNQDAYSDDGMDVDEETSGSNRPPDGDYCMQIDSLGMPSHLSVANTFGDASMLDIAHGTPTRQCHGVTGGVNVPRFFPTPPSASPLSTVPNTPCSSFSECIAPVEDFERPSSRYHCVGIQAEVQLQRVGVDAGVQASFLDPEKQLLQEEIDSMRLELSKATAMLHKYEAFSSRLGAHVEQFAGRFSQTSIIPCLPPPETTPSSIYPSPSSMDVEARLVNYLETSASRNSILHNLTSSLTHTLGLPPSTSETTEQAATTVIHTLTNTLRMLRLELEHLKPISRTTHLPHVKPRHRRPLAPIDISSTEDSLPCAVELLLARLRELTGRAVAADRMLATHAAREAELQAEVAACQKAAANERNERTRLQRVLEQRDQEMAGLRMQVCANCNGGGCHDTRNASGGSSEVAEAETGGVSIDGRFSTLEQRIFELEATQANHAARMVYDQARLLSSRDRCIADLSANVARLHDEMAASLLTVQRSIAAIAGDRACHGSYSMSEVVQRREWEMETETDMRLRWDTDSRRESDEDSGKENSYESRSEHENHWRWSWRAAKSSTRRPKPRPTENQRGPVTKRTPHARNRVPLAPRECDGELCVSDKVDVEMTSFEE